MSARGRILDAARLARDIAGLASTPRRTCTTAALCPDRAVDLDHLLRPDGPAAWPAVAARLEAVGLDHPEGGMSPEDCRALAAMIAVARPAYLLEIGTHVGASTLTLAAALDELGAGMLTTVDVLDVNGPDAPWARLGLPFSPAGAARHLGLHHRLRFHHGSAQRFLHASRDRFNFILLDGDHRARPLYAEICAALSRLADGGWLVLHDYHERLRRPSADHALIPGPFLVVKRLLREDPSLRARPLGTLPWATTGQRGRTTLVLLARAT